MSLNEKLQQMKAASLSRIPAEKAAIMAQATRKLGESGIVDRVLAVGEKAPEFVLQDFSGREHASAELLAKGPVILSFYRGSW